MNGEMKEKSKEEIKLVQNLLPDDMIVEILSRLPVKSLYRFRCVCKSWCLLICPDHFVRLNKNHQKLFILFKQNYSILDCYELTSEMVKVEFPIIKDYSPLPTPLDRAEIITSCDGWLLLSVRNCDIRKKLFLFNPFAEDYKVFPVPPYATREYPRSYGICYDFSDNDYKIVCIVGWRSHNTIPFFTVFSFKTDSWTSIRFLPDWVDHVWFSRAVSCNGALNWIVKGMNEMLEILGFDSKGEFKQIPKPPEEIFIENKFMLVALRGNLCAHGYSPDLGSMLVMEMKQYGVKESWTQVCSINSHGSYNMRALAFTKKGELVIDVFEFHTIVIYNVEDNSSKTLKGLENLKNPNEMGIYTDSSITLNCDCLLNGIIP